MAGLNGRTMTFRASENKRVLKYCVMVAEASTGTTDKKESVKLPTAANTAGFMGVTVDHFVEPNFFVTQSTKADDATNGTGTTPVTYSLIGRGVTLQTSGRARFRNSGATITQGNELVIADVNGRVKAAPAVDAGGKVYVLGIAQNTTSGEDDVVMAEIQVYAKTVATS